MDVSRSVLPDSSSATMRSSSANACSKLSEAISPPLIRPLSPAPPRAGATLPGAQAASNLAAAPSASATLAERGSQARRFEPPRGPILETPIDRAAPAEAPQRDAHHGVEEP